MTLIHLKRNNDDGFLFSAPSGTSNDKLIRDLVELHNLRLRIERLNLAVEDLIQHGPYKHPNEHGLSEDQIKDLVQNDDDDEPDEPGSGEKAKEEEVEWQGQRYIFRSDPTGRRLGYAPLKLQAETLKQAVEEAKSKAKNILEPMEASKLIEAIESVKGAVLIAYPMQLPAYDPVREILEDTEDLSGTQASKEVLDPNTATLWWAGKELKRSQTLSDFCGKNDKTKIIAKLQKKGSGAPVREPPIDEKAQKEMMAYYYKKQEEHKKLLESADDDYLHSSWADPNALKRQFNGLGNISWHPR